MTPASIPMHMSCLTLRSFCYCQLFDNIKIEKKEERQKRRKKKQHLSFGSSKAMAARKKRMIMVNIQIFSSFMNAISR